MGNANVNNSRNRAGDHRSIDANANQIAGPSNPQGPGALHLDEDDDSSRLARIGYGESMLQSPPDSLSSRASSASRSPLMFNPPTSMPIARGDDLSRGPYDNNAYDHQEYGNLQQERGVPTMIVWSHGGNSVAVEGSWDNWATRQPMQKVGNDFTLVKMLPSGVYHYQIVLDENWHYPEEVLLEVHNVLDVRDYVPENLDSIAGFEPPGSGISSYNGSFPSAEDFSKEPPELPPHLHLALLNVPPCEELLPRPQNVSLNHLYVEKADNLQAVLALGLTHRYRSKYVTVALYKPINK